MNIFRATFAHSEEPTTSASDGRNVTRFRKDGLTDSTESGHNVWWKIDRHVIPVAVLFYLLSWLDRANVGNARVAGLQRDLGLTSTQYSTALTVTFIPYILTELPSNLILKIVGPNVLLPTLMLGWGIATTMQGFVYNYAGFLVCRFFIGFFEGGLLPGLVLYLSGFYPRNLLQLRLSVVFSSVALSGAFSGLLATAISKMHGMGNRPAWAWIFILEGLITVIFGGFSFWLLPSSPVAVRFLSEEEKRYVVERLRDSDATSGSDSEPLKWAEVRAAFKLPHVWLMLLSAFFGGTVTFSLAPSAASLGLLFILLRRKKWVLYGSLFLTITGTTCSGAAHQTWMANSTSPHIRRAAGIAALSMVVNCAGILSTWLLGSLSAPPRYFKAMVTLLVFSALGAILTMVTILYLWDQNKRKAKRRGDLGKEEEPQGLGDRSAWFIYIL